MSVADAALRRLTHQSEPGRHGDLATREFTAEDLMGPSGRGLLTVAARTYANSSAQRVLHELSAAVAAERRSQT